MPYYSLLCLILTLANALTLDTPSTAWEVGDNTTVNWSSTSEDPSTFALQLYEIYYNQLYTVSDDVATSLGSLTFPVPVVSQGCVSCCTMYTHPKFSLVAICEQKRVDAEGRQRQVSCGERVTTQCNSLLTIMQRHHTSSVCTERGVRHLGYLEVASYLDEEPRESLYMLEHPNSPTFQHTHTGMCVIGNNIASPHQRIQVGRAKPYLHEE